MILQVMGCWAPFPRPGEACSGYLLSTGSTHVLIDCGHSAASHLAAALNPERLDAVIISHFHPDHYVDLYALRHMIRAALMRGTRQNPLPVYLPVQNTPEYQTFASMGELQIRPLQEKSSFMAGDIQLECLPVEHSLPCFAIRAVHQGPSFLYTADTSWHNRLQEAVSGVNVLLCEASLLENASDYAAQIGHMTTAQAGRLAQTGGVGHLIATHFWPDYDIGQLQNEIRQAYSGKLTMASQGLRVEI